MNIGINQGKLAYDMNRAFCVACCRFRSAWCQTAEGRLIGYTLGLNQGYIRVIIGYILGVKL